MNALRSNPYRPYKTINKTQKVKKQRSLAKRVLFLIVGIVIIAGVFIGYVHAKKDNTSISSSTISNNSTKQTVPLSASKSVPALPTNACANNSLSQMIIVSISQRHMWACSLTTRLYDTAVITGMQNLPADLTPTGTYHIYAKETHVYLKGSDSTGSWNDYVYYWLPFLYNQYGTYGFHDATWRAPNDFGAISPYSSNASHGCVEMPLNASKWLYGWAQIGTTVTINS